MSPILGLLPLQSRGSKDPLQPLNLIGGKDRPSASLVIYRQQLKLPLGQSGKAFDGTAVPCGPCDSLSGSGGKWKRCGLAELDWSAFDRHDRFPRWQVLASAVAVARSTLSQGGLCTYVSCQGAKSNEAETLAFALNWG